MKKSYYLLDHVTSLQVQYCAPLRTQVKLWQLLLMQLTPNEPLL